VVTAAERKSLTGEKITDCQ